ncbi:MAG: mechanosensitive ion channel protein MscS, partial [Cyanobacteria bacterium J06632_19]
MRNKPKLSNLKYFKPVTVIIIILMLVFGLQFLPAVAQSNQSATVDIDGIPIFRVHNTVDKQAKDRADTINNILENAVNAETIPEIKVEKGDNFAKILVGDNQQFTITSKDVDSEANPNEQAKKWADKIREKINRARQERSEEFIRKTLAASFMLVVLTAALHWVLGRVWITFERNISPLITSEDSSDQNQLQSSLNILLKATLFLTRTALWIGISLYITNLFPLTRQWSFDIAAIIRDSLTSPIFKDFSITGILVLIGLFLGLIVLAGAVTNVLRS